MRKAAGSSKVWIGAGLAGLILALAHAVPALAQETPDQFDAANAENRRHSAVENQLRGQAHDLRTDRMRALQTCAGAGSPAAQKACTSNVEIDQRQRGLMLDNKAIEERNTHDLILKGIGVHRVP
jgi:hypothetical protein